MTTARFALAFAALLFTATHTGVALAQKIGVVDLQRALVETEDGRKAKDQLKKLFEQRQKTLDKQQDDLKAMKESVEKQREVLAREVWAKKVEDLQKALAELQTTYMEFQRELQAKEAEMLRPIQERMQRIVKRLGQADGYSLIVDRTVAYFVPSSSDLTDVLIQRYNAGEGKDEGGGKAGKPAASATKAKAAPK
jgi:outer membrane protein